MHLFILSLVISLGFFTPCSKSFCPANVPEKENLTIEDYIEVQKQLQTINPSPLVQEMHAMSGNVMQVEIFESRCESWNKTDDHRCGKKSNSVLEIRKDRQGRRSLHCCVHSFFQQRFQKNYLQLW